MKHSRDWLIATLESTTREQYEAEGVEGDFEAAVWYWQRDCTMQQLRDELARMLQRGRRIGRVPTQTA